MRAVWNSKVLAEAKKNELIRIEGNWYFPPDSLNKEYFSPSETRTECPWKGIASYSNVVLSETEKNPDAAWFYEHPKAGSIERVGKDYTNFVAFWHGVVVVD